MYGLKLPDLFNFTEVQKAKRSSCDTLTSVFINDYPEVNEKHLRRIISKLLVKEYNEIVNEYIELEANGEVMTEEFYEDVLNCYVVDFGECLKHEVNEFNKCVLNKVGDMKLKISGVDVVHFKHSKHDGEGVKIHRFMMGPTI